MKKVLSKSLLIVAICFLCCLPILMFGGCNPNNDISGAEELDNVKMVSVYQYTKDASYSPYQNKVWVDKQSGRIIFYVSRGYSSNDEKHIVVQKYNFPLERCALIYEDTEKSV